MLSITVIRCQHFSNLEEELHCSKEIIKENNTGYYLITNGYSHYVRKHINLVKYIMIFCLIKIINSSVKQPPILKYTVKIFTARQRFCSNFTYLLLFCLSHLQHHLCLRTANSWKTRTIWHYMGTTTPTFQILILKGQ